MKIVFEIATNSVEEFRYLVSVAAQTEGQIYWAIFLNGTAFSSSDNLQTDNLIARYRELAIFDPCISFMELRQQASAIGTLFDPDFRIMADGDFEFKRDWINFVQSACIDMERFRSLSGRDCYLNMTSSFGDVRPFRTTRVSTNRALSGMMSGFILPRAAGLEQIALLPGGFDDIYLQCIWFSQGFIPLVKRSSPIYHHKSNIRTRTELMHSREIIYLNYHRLARELFGDPNWCYPLHYKHAESTDDKNYSHLPKKQLDQLRATCDSLASSGKLDNFFSDVYMRQVRGF
jgi:hypothetical protein